MTILEIHNRLKKAGIPSRYEYPGYCAIDYRSIDVTVGLDDNDLVIQAQCEDGTAVDSINWNIPVSLNVEDSDLLMTLCVNLISAAYLNIDAFIKTSGYHHKNENDVR